MKIYRFVQAAILAATIPAAVLADDPNDPAMRNAAARARDREIVRQLNQQELARVRARDARYAEGWRAWRGDGAATPAYNARSRDSDDYARDRAQYDRQMAAWHRAVAACRAGDYSACDD